MTPEPEPDDLSRVPVQKTVMVREEWTEVSFFESSESRSGSHDSSFYRERARGIVDRTGRFHDFPELSAAWTPLWPGVEARWRGSALGGQSGTLTLRVHRDACPLHLLIVREEEYWSDDASIGDGINTSRRREWALRVELEAAG